ncbi:hypothetical protein BCR44DRAFT_1234279 [Catenaria anguillulae PL171]|uniref:Uncharacterized protein n=1 Tax=Catenaria anguillulae PL171 TaxID=765915 RepID=A0A1Y2HDF0_9FUNG|nr:hypothetical protein BCR44DRAFT_1234279 [Catenaria anguillulae PL171]
MGLARQKASRTTRCIATACFAAVRRSKRDRLVGGQGGDPLLLDRRHNLELSVAFANEGGNHDPTTAALLLQGVSPPWFPVHSHAIIGHKRALVVVHRDDCTSPRRQRRLTYPGNEHLFPTTTTLAILWAPTWLIFGIQAKSIQRSELERIQNDKLLDGCVHLRRIMGHGSNELGALLQYVLAALAVGVGPFTIHAVNPPKGTQPAFRVAI